MNSDVQKKAGVIGVLAVLLVALWAFDNIGYDSGDYVTGYQVSSGSKVPGYDLQKGWNLIAVSTNMVGKAIANAQGNCQIDGFQLSTGQRINPRYIFSADQVLKAFWVHVRGDCSLNPNARMDNFASSSSIIPNLKKGTNYVAVTTDMVGNGLRKLVDDANLVGVSYDNKQCQLELKGIAVYDSSLKNWKFVETLSSSDVGKGVALKLQCASEKPKATTKTGADTTTQTCTDNDRDTYGIGDGCRGAQDCNDNNVKVNPGTAEVCGDGIDNDCSGGDAVCPAVTATSKTGAAGSAETAAACTSSAWSCSWSDSANSCGTKICTLTDTKCSNPDAVKPTPEKKDCPQQSVTAKPSCTSAAWKCTFPEECPNSGFRTSTTCTLIDTTCTSPEAAKPATQIQTCTPSTTATLTPTCTDKVQNGDETGIDCGGSKCAACPGVSGTAGVSDIPGFNLQKGWNFITVSTDMVGETVDSVKGDCRVVKVNVWTTKSEWKLQPPTEKFTSANSLKGLGVQVEGACSFNPSATKDNVASSSLSLVNGWNYVAVTADMVGKDLKQLVKGKGCEMEVAHLYEEGEWKQPEMLGSSDIGRSVGIHAAGCSSKAGVTGASAKPDLEIISKEPMFRLENRAGNFRFSELKAGDRIKTVFVEVENKGAKVTLKKGSYYWHVSVSISAKGVMDADGRDSSYSCNSYDYPNVGKDGKLPKENEKFNAGAHNFPSGCNELKEFGEYAVKVTVDSTNLIDESNEGNNVKEFAVGEVKTTVERICSTPGDITGSRYCSSGKRLLDRKAAGAACSSHYECFSYVCSRKACLSESEAARLITG